MTSRLQPSDIAPVEDVEAALRGVLEHWPSLRAAWLFGSVAAGSAGPLSDVDVAVLGAAPRLLQHGVLDPPLAERLRGLSGFRNLLVHEYGTVDYGMVHEKLGRLDELAGFAAAIEE